MQVTETLNDGLKRAYQISLSAAELDEKVEAKLKEAQPSVELKGFRKGKVPMAMLRKQFGERVLGEALQESVDGALGDHLKETGHRPVMQPDMKMTNEDWKPGDDVEIAVEYEILPDMPEVDFGAIALERMVVKAEQADVDEALENLAKSAQQFEAKDGKAEDGDQAVIDFLGKLDGEPFEGGAGEAYPLVLGSNSFIPGFEEQLVGLKAGEQKDVELSFPEEYHAEHLAGKAVVFEVTMQEVKSPVAAELNDDLAKQFGAEDLAALTGQITERLEAEYKGAARAVVKRGLLDDLDGRVDFDLPQSLLDAEAGQIAHQLWHEENPDVQGHDHDKIEPNDEHKELAARRVKLGLLLAELGQRAEIEVTDAEMTQAVMMQARQYPGQEREFFEAVQKNPQLQQQLRAPLFEDKVVDHILEQAKITEKEVSKDELQNAIEAMEADDG